MPTLPTAERPVTDVPAAPAADALAHFQRLLSFETDCWDVHTALGAGHPGFVVLDVRSPEDFAAGHVPGALNLPHRRIARAEPVRPPAGHAIRRVLLRPALQRGGPGGGGAGAAGPTGQEDDRGDRRLEGRGVRAARRGVR